MIVELDYRVASENARAYHNLMPDVQLYRRRNGACGWSIARDIADPELWTAGPVGARITREGHGFPYRA
ncbi:MFS transporter [Bradyrhizobium sp. 195]|nr:MFS transporter [Bradyrhizobium sp. 195]